MARDFMCTKTEPVVQTKAGKLRGFRIDGVYAFHGVKYADAKRFQQPEPVQPWEGIKNALAYGYVCPMLKQDEPNNELMVPHRYWPLDENCQYLNIWTKSLDPSAKKPVLVWLHGGGFAAGSSIEHIAYEGENMSRYGDVVVVSLNHRLNILGYLDLSPFGEKYANSGNAGSADMVAALQWIHDNIAGFGGDPDNVTLFGQSGGGMKVWTLMQTPAADGLFHKGIVQSGCIDGEGDARGRKDRRLRRRQPDAERLVPRRPVRRRLHGAREDDPGHGRHGAGRVCVHARALRGGKGRQGGHRQAPAPHVRRAHRSAAEAVRRGVPG